MSKSIKISESVYQTLVNIQDKRETFSQEIERLLIIKASAEALADKLSSAMRSTREYEQRGADHDVPKVR